MVHAPTLLAIQPPHWQPTHVDHPADWPRGCIAIEAEGWPGAELVSSVPEGIELPPWVPRFRFSMETHHSPAAPMPATSPRTRPHRRRTARNERSDDLGRRALDAVRQRHPPTPEAISQWIAARLDSPFHASDLLTALSERPETERSSADRALRRRLARLGPLGRNDWRRLAILARLARTAATVDRLAIEADVNVTYLRTWIRRLLGVPAKAYRQLPAWEAVLELGLRRAGMVLHPGTG